MDERESRAKAAELPSQTADQSTKGTRRLEDLNSAELQPSAAVSTPWNFPEMGEMFEPARTRDYGRADPFANVSGPSNGNRPWIGRDL